SDHVALIIGKRDGNPPVVRLHSECLTGGVSSMAHLLSANLSRNPRCLRAEASIFAIAYS
ncbi:hypothetical protein, partial [Sphingopyxis terrae]